MRTGMVPAMRLLAVPPRASIKIPQKTIFVLEEMAILRDKKTVATSQLPTQDLVTISGYLDADLTLIAANNVRQMILDNARDFFTPTNVMKLRNHIKLIRPVDLPQFLDKRTDGGYPVEGEVPNVIFSGRMNASSSRLASIFRVLVTDFAFNKEKSEDYMVSSVTKAPQLAPPSFLDVKNNDREAFWKLLREEAHVGLYMALDAEFSLTVIEPICFGVPLVLAKEDWSTALVGSDYPFFINGDTQAYAMLRDIKENYATRYEEFIQWREKSFRPRFAEGGVYGDSLVDVAADGINRIVLDREAYQLPETDMVHALAETAVLGETVNMIDLFDRAVAEKRIGEGTYVPKAWPSENIPASFKVNFQSARVKLQTFYGAEDANTGTGNLYFPTD